VPEKDIQFRKTKVPSSYSSSRGPIFHFVDPPSDVKRAVLQLDAIGLAAMEKFDGILIDKRHVPQIQNQLLPRCLAGEQLLKLLDIVGCFDPAAKCEQNSTIACSPSSQHASSLCLKMPDAGWNIIPFALVDAL
jgi:hypothetical protein